MTLTSGIKITDPIQECPAEGGGFQYGHQDKTIENKIHQYVKKKSKKSVCRKTTTTTTITATPTIPLPINNLEEDM